MWHTSILFACLRQYEGFVIFEIIFAFEAVTKIVANGLWYHEQAYLKQR